MTAVSRRQPAQLAWAAGGRVLAGAARLAAARAVAAPAGRIARSAVMSSKRGETPEERKARKEAVKVGVGLRCTALLVLTAGRHVAQALLHKPCCYCMAQIQVANTSSTHPTPAPCALQQQKAARRAQREGAACANVGRKACTLCGELKDTLIRCQVDASGQWHMVRLEECLP